MTERYNNKYRSDSIRIKNWDYGSPGFYYVTICTKDRECYFGQVVVLYGPIDADIHGRTTPPWNDRPWAGVCGGIAGTHNYASLPPTAHPSHALDARSAHGYAFVKLTPIGKIARKNWIDIPKHFPFVVLDEFVIMPNHIHGVVSFKKAGYRDRNTNSFGPQSENLASVIRNYKSATKAYATSHGIEFAWQARYHDDVVTSGRELDKIRAYIRNNPASWIEKNQIKKP